jgi:hypothetical protein
MFVFLLAVVVTAVWLKVRPLRQEVSREVVPHSTEASAPELGVIAQKEKESQTQPLPSARALQVTNPFTAELVGQLTNVSLPLKDPTASRARAGQDRLG